MNPVDNSSYTEVEKTFSDENRSISWSDIPIDFTAVRLIRSGIKIACIFALRMV